MDKRSNKQKWLNIGASILAPFSLGVALRILIGMLGVGAAVAVPNMGFSNTGEGTWQLIAKSVEIGGEDALELCKVAQDLVDYGNVDVVVLISDGYDTTYDKMAYAKEYMKQHTPKDSTDNVLIWVCKDFGIWTYTILVQGDHIEQITSDVAPDGVAAGESMTGSYDDIKAEFNAVLDSVVNQTKTYRENYEKYWE